MIRPGVEMSPDMSAPIVGIVKYANPYCSRGVTGCVAVMMFGLILDSRDVVVELWSHRAEWPSLCEVTADHWPHFADDRSACLSGLNSSAPEMSRKNTHLRRRVCVGRKTLLRKLVIMAIRTIRNDILKPKTQNISVIFSRHYVDFLRFLAHYRTCK